jgi:hypothetical protein
MPSKDSGDFFVSLRSRQAFLYLRPAKLSHLADFSAEIGSPMPKNNPTLTMFPQKGFISAL